MISKGLRGGRLGGLMRYLFGPGRHEEHTHQRVVACSDPTWVGTVTPDSETLASLVNELDEPYVAFGDPTKDGYVYHVVVSIPEVDGPLSDEQWNDTARTFATRLGLDDGVQWVAVHHGASVNGNDHIHMVVNLIRDDGRTVNLWQEGMKRRGACLELEEKYQLTATAQAGLGEGSLSRREVEQVRGGQVSAVADLTRHRVATVVRAVALGARSEPEFVERLRGEGLIVRGRLDKTNPKHVTGYSIAARGGDADGKLVWYGGGTLGKDLRLPALRARWRQTPDQRAAAATTWTSDAQRARKAEPQNLTGAATALRTASSLLSRVPASDHFAWYQAATDSAGVLAAAAAATTDDRLRRELISAWKSVHKAIPLSADSRAEPRTMSGEQVEVPTSRNWPRPAVAAAAGIDREASTLLAGASRVLMAARLADAPHDAQIRTLLLQAIQLAAQINRTIAARSEASAAQQRAARATSRVAELAAAPTTVGGWQFTRTGAEVLESARAARAAGHDVAVSRDPGTGPAPGPDLAR
ncbi:relaxase/mobilisation nuclease-like protein [Jatrophihabitans sp. GAS493]|uniref:relaxase/mobilization nuclease domain-containing protein n=1 Tax=Jatrophihabitans sp. GAS493 TaxID=1907575 RepID=UPI000BB9A359|nr:relaxase/mobilization nuclease domain-containing protein [Jatrophihabitans sp. GAS493]SOD72909.1 relaxase/mobilisation nuclease-like protein [Jatrophihabitans sp. GAS493]